eukprot:364532-Chlamydomonas_euryale.AAC.7
MDPASARPARHPSREAAAAAAAAPPAAAGVATRASPPRAASHGRRVQTFQQRDMRSRLCRLRRLCRLQRLRWEPAKRPCMPAAEHRP